MGVTKYNIPIHSANKVEYGSLREFFIKYFIFLKPYHNLSNKEMIIAAELYRRKYELSKVILDGQLLDTIVLNPENKRLVRQNAGNINTNQFNVTLAKFNKLGIIKDGRLNPKFMPPLTQEGDRFNLLISFNFSENSDDSMVRDLEDKGSKKRRTDIDTNEYQSEEIQTDL